MEKQDFKVRVVVHQGFCFKSLPVFYSIGCSYKRNTGWGTIVHDVCWLYYFGKRKSDKVNQKLDEWRLGGKRLRNSRNKIEYIEYEFGGRGRKQLIDETRTISGVGEIRNLRCWIDRSLKKVLTTFWTIGTEMLLECMIWCGKKS